MRLWILTFVRMTGELGEGSGLMLAFRPALP